MDDSAKAESILSNYKKKSDEIIEKMLDVIVKASKKADNASYQKILNQVDQEIASL